MMRLPVLLRIMTLATLVSTARLTEPTMCANDTDFKAQSLLPEATGGARCEDASLYLLSNFAGGRTSWSDVACQEIAKDVSFAQALLQAARYCCGKGLPRCFDMLQHVQQSQESGSNMCKNFTHLMPDVTVSADGTTCTQVSVRALQHMNEDSLASTGKRVSLTWNDVTCVDLARTKSEAALRLAEAGQRCCGGLERTRCFDGSNMCKNAADFTPNNLSGVVVDGRALACSMADALALSWFPGKSI